MAKNKQRGYYELDTPIGKKTLHFSMNFLFLLEEVTGESFTVFAEDIAKQKGIGSLRDTSTIVFCAMVAYDQEEENEIDYNLFKVRNWVSDIIISDSKVTGEIMDALINSSALGKLKAAAEQQAAKK